MKFSLNTIKFLNQHYDSAGDPAADGTDSLIQKIGAQLGEVSEVIEFGKRFEDIVIAKVVSCQDHPDADRLHVCLIDDGGKTPDVERNSEGHIQVVCGAPNVREGLLVAWLPPGATVPDSYDKETFVLEAREIRGQVSNGMLASPKELSLSDNHDGILEITLDKDEHIVPGTSFAEAYHLKGDILIDIENKMFTHRPDCFGYLGIARELEGIQGRVYKSPSWYTPQPDFPAIEAEELKLEVRNELPELASRFAAVVLRNVAVKPSPAWLQVDLARAGVRPINNIVDYTNWFMLLTGQPLHAYDYDKVKSLSNGEATIIIRNPHASEKIKLLNGKEIEPRAEAIMIATDKQAIGIGGVMGGTQTEVDNDTKNIIIESANFDMYSIRRTSMASGLFTDAVTRFTKGQSPLQCVAVLARMVQEVRDHAGGQVASPLIDDHQPDPVLNDATVHPPVEVSKDFINQRLGLQLDDDAIMKLLTNVEFNCHTIPDGICVTAPFWRTDIELREDVVEEVGRLYGYDKLPLELPKRDLTPVTKDPLLTFKAAIRQKLSAADANEVLTYSFVPGSLLDKVGQDKDKAFQISNALSPDLQYYRLSLMPSLLDKVHPNIKAGYGQFALFELGKVHNLDHFDDAGLPREFEFTTLVVTANDKLKAGGAPFYQARQYLEALTGDAELSFKPISSDMAGYPVVQPYDHDRAALVSLKDGTFLGVIGEFKTGVLRALKLPKYTAGFEIDTTVLETLENHSGYVPLSRFPSVKQDISFKLAADLAYGKLYDFVAGQLAAHRPAETDTQIEPIDIYQNPDDAVHKHITLRLTVTGQNRTLTDSEVNQMLDGIADAAKAELDAERI